MMAALEHKIDFIGFVLVTRANPNGDPLNGNQPRTDYDGYGEISDVCLKRKIRNRLQDMGEAILVQSNDRSDDGFTSIRERVEANPSLEKILKMKENLCKFNVSEITPIVKRIMKLDESNKIREALTKLNEN